MKEKLAMTHHLKQTEPITKYHLIHDGNTSRAFDSYDEAETEMFSIHGEEMQLWKEKHRGFHGYETEAVYNDGYDTVYIVSMTY